MTHGLLRSSLGAFRVSVLATAGPSQGGTSAEPCGVLRVGFAESALQSIRVYRFVEHTAELEIELEACSPEGVLEEARRAFAELAGTGSGELVERSVEIAATDLPALLAAWLDELVFLADTEGLVPESADLELNGAELTGVVRGRRGAPRPLVKAVTLHRLRLRGENGVWRGRVVLDV
jgi:SHS2 domain-containing protein